MSDRSAAFTSSACSCRSKRGVEIRDIGCGTPASDVDRIFEPFFSTKEGSGTGRGLSISHRVVSSAGGALTCEARPVGGTVFRVSLPAFG